MLTITKREQIGTIHGKAIYRIGAFQILPLADNLNSLNENQVRCRTTAGRDDYGSKEKLFNRECKNKNLLISLKAISRTIPFIIRMIMI